MLKFKTNHKKLKDNTGKRISVIIEEENISYMMTENGKGERHVKRVLKKDEEGYYIKWNGIRLDVGLFISEFENEEITLNYHAYRFDILPKKY